MPDFAHRICDKLNSKNLSAVADECVQNIVQFSQADTKDVCDSLSFLLQFGFYQQALTILYWLIEHHQVDLIWRYLGYIVAQIELTTEQHLQIEKWLVQQNLGADFVYFSEQHQFQQNPSWTKNWQNQILERQNIVKKQYLDEVKTARNQGQTENEEKYLIKLLQFFPDDLAAKKELRQFRERKAFAVLDDYKNKKSAINLNLLINEGHHRIDFSHLAPDLQIDSLNEDLIIAALMIEDYETCIQLLNFIDASEKNDWLKLEILLRAGHAAELLNFTFEVEQKYSLHAESYYACMYYRACAYWSLDQKNQALAIMKEIISHNPDYRQSSQLFREWNGQ